MTDHPNVVMIVVDDMGYSDLGCYGGEIDTPNLDRLAERGVRMSQFYNTARCSPSRASLLTGLHPHQTGIGVLTRNDGPKGYPGTINERCVTIPEVLRQQGYGTYMSGKWHLTNFVEEPHDSWPTRRGFDHYYGIIAGGASYYYPRTLTRDETNIDDECKNDPEYYLTTAIGANAATFVRAHHAHHPDRPFFLYTAFTAPHWPLHADEQTIAKYRGRFSAGWDQLRRERRERQVASGLLDGDWADSGRDHTVGSWDDEPDRAWQERRMEIYAAQIDLMDKEIGRIVAALEETGRLEDTLLMFISDNGGCAEELPDGWIDEQDNVPIHMRAQTKDGERVRRGNNPELRPGPPDTYCSYGKAWANLSNTPFREYKHWVHEGGIATPLIAHWPAGLEPETAGSIVHAPHQLPDIMATVLEATGAAYPGEVPGRDPLPLEGTSMLGTWRGEPADPERTLFWEHEGNAAIRRGPWKLVKRYPDNWELYDVEADRTEVHDRSPERRDVVDELRSAYRAWADRCGVIPRSQVLSIDEVDGGPPR